MAMPIILINTNTKMKIRVYIIAVLHIVFKVIYILLINISIDQ
jgi:hypothetical protein